jgi:choline-sulfatase
LQAKDRPEKNWGTVLIFAAKNGTAAAELRPTEKSEEKGTRHMKNLVLTLVALLSLAATVAAAQPPNVLFIMTDQQFGDAMSCRMGEQYLHTPAMDSLANSGMVFTRAYTANPLCMPARASLFTGRYPHEVGVTKNAQVKFDPAEFVSLGTYFRQAGYETAYFGKWHLCYDLKNVSTHGFETTKGSASGKQDHDAKVSGAAVEFLAQKHNQPLLLVASFLNPHNICEYARREGGIPGQNMTCGDVGSPPPPGQCPPAPLNLAPPQNEPDGMTIMRSSYQATKTFPVGKFTADNWRQQRWGYYRMIEKVDGEIGKVLQALRQAGLEENTLIIFTADHGECAGAHGFNQKTVFYEESARVPLIVSFKGKTMKGSTDKLVNTGLDILPTMFDFAGIAVPQKLTGRSLRPLAQGQPVAEWRDYVVVENHLVQGGEVDGILPSLEGRMVRTDRYKYCVYSRGSRRESLVDIQADPGETKDLAAEAAYRKVLLEHREILAKFAREHHDPLAAELVADDVPARPFTPDTAKKPRKER